MKSFLLIGVLICLACSTAGCGGYGSSSSNYTGPPTTLSLTGNWQFSYTSSKAGSAPATVSGALTQNGSSFSGNMTITGSCAMSGMISGTLSGYTLTSTTLNVTANGAPAETITITVGTVATNFNSASGTYQVMSAMGACASAMGDTGTWTGTRMSSGGGPYVGMLMSADRLPVQVTLNLKNDGSQQVSGTATFTNSACLGSLSVAGTQSGANLDLHSQGGADSSIVLSGMLNEGGRTLTLSSAVSGPCQAESGAGTLTKMQ